MVPVAVVLELIVFACYTLRKKGVTLAAVLRRVHTFLLVFPLTKRSIKRVTTRVSKLSIYGPEDISVIVTKYVLKGLFAAALLVAAGLLLFSDVLSKTMCFIFAFILYSNVIEKSIDSTHLAVLKSTKNALLAIEQEYMKSENIPEALSSARVDKLLARTIEEIHSIISEGGSEVKLQQFYAHMPFHPIQTLAGICYNMNIYGDNKDIYGRSSFIQALGILRSDINASIEKLTLQKAKFSSLECAPVLSVFLITPMESWLVDTMPGVALIYNGLLGYIFRTLVILSAIVGYGVVSRLNRAVVLQENDQSRWAERLLKNRVWRKFIEGISPKKLVQICKLKLNLKHAMSKQSILHFYTKKAAFALAGFVGCLAVLSIALAFGKDYSRNTVDELALVATANRTPEQKETMRAMDDIYFAAEGSMSMSEATALVQSKMPELSDMETADEVKRMQDKYKNWSELEFKFYFVWIAAAVGLAAWFVPNLMLLARKMLIRAEAEDDFMQLQTLVSILIYTGVDTLAILQQMAQHSTVHKDILREAYHRFPSAPELELERLKAKTPLTEFKLFIDKLRLTISELPMTGAFSGLIADRESFQRLREIKFQASLEKKRAIGKFLSSAPLALFVFSEFAFPIFLLGMQEYTKTMGTL